MENSLRHWNARPLYLPPKKYVSRSRRNRTGHETTAWFQIEKEYVKAVYRHPAYLTYMQSKYIMQNAGLDKAQTGIKIAGRNINNLR